MVHDYMLEAAKGLVSYSPNVRVISNLACTPISNIIEKIMKLNKEKVLVLKPLTTHGSMSSSSKKPRLFCGLEEMGDTS